MITASKMISFNDGVAESLTIRVGEKNRQFKFSPDIDINDYDVKMVIIKPDNTFTITDCSIDDGFIIAAIPEQAAAVPGLGGYNIRVYDNDTNIYSAAGGVWVDDSLLNEELIESVAEVNGYVFPDDFFTTGDIEANPSGDAADVLDKIRIFNTIYSIEGTEPELSLDDLTDVTIMDPENGEVLTRSGNNWINAALPDLPPVSKTASGNPVEFDDGADAPLVKCVSAITGSQDLHGYDKPWGAGAGKNKLPITVSDIKANNTAGSWNGNVFTTNYGISIELLTNDDNIIGFKVNGTSTAQHDFKLINAFNSTTAFSGAGTYTSSMPQNDTLATMLVGYGVNVLMNNTTVTTATVTDGLAWCLMRFPENSTYTNAIFEPMIRLATESSTFAPYSNICPITAYTEGEIEVSDGDGNITTHTTTYPSAIYRGSEDCVKGEVTKEWNLVDLSTLTWAYDSSRKVFYSGDNIGANQRVGISCVCDRYNAINNVNSINVMVSAENGSIAFLNANSGTYRLYVKDTAYTDATAFTASLSGSQFAYELLTPTTSSVTTTNLPIKSLNGYNHIESSTGEMEVEYITQHYEPIIKAAEILAQS